MTLKRVELLIRPRTLYICTFFFLITSLPSHASLAGCYSRFPPHGYTRHIQRTTSDISSARDTSAISIARPISSLTLKPPTEVNMATCDDMARLEKKLIGEQPLSWVISGQPVIALFSSPERVLCEHLGHPSPHNQVSDSLRLWVGLNEQTGQLLVTLTQRIKVSTTGRARLLFLIVPSESLGLESAAPAFWALSKEDVPLNLLEMPSDERSGQTSRLLRMSFYLGSNGAKSRVIMPAQLYEGSALSEVDHFDLFTNHNSWTQVGLHKTQAMLENGSLTITTPSFDLKALYPGQRDGGFDLWLEQGWRDQENSNSVKPAALRKRNKRGRVTGPACKKRRALKSPSPPPPYGLPSRLSSPSVVENTTTIVPPPADAAAAAAAAATVPITTPVLALVSTYEHAPTSNSAIEPALIPASIPCSPAVSQSPVQSQTFRRCDARELSSSCIPETPIVITHARCESRCPPHTTRSAEHSTSHVAQDNVPRITFDTQISLWLTQVWELCPYAHYIFIVGILKLGAAAHRADAETFHGTRVACTDDLLSLCAKEELAKASNECSTFRTFPISQALSTKKHALRDEIPALISWLLILDSTADVKLFPSLWRLTVIKEHLTRSSTLSDDEYSQISSKFVQLKAVIVTEACVRWGSQVLNHNKDIEATMMREKERAEAKACSDQGHNVGL
ncbi:hypothetical protein BDV97DRAFT_388184 [Delphinella strobiligena]|nr:hypothetical protein BDV97DRAFT_388184 [Delphinella strobiligena]